MSKNEKLPEYDYNRVPTKEIIKEKLEVPHYGYGIRHIQLVIFLICLTVNFMGRGHMGVTIVAMTSNLKENHTVVDTVNTTKEITPIRGYVAEDEDNIYNNTMIEDIDENYIILSARNETNEKEVISSNVTGVTYPKFPWPKSTQEMVLGSFFLGYCVMTFPMGLVAQKYGGKIPLQIALFINGVTSILTPWLTNWGGWKAICVCRILQGFSQAGVYPSIQTLLGKWVPANERGSLSSYVYTGSTIGTVIAFQLAGVLSDSRWGWPSTFWAVGVICLANFIVLTVFGVATPAQHKTITDAEKNYIMGKIDDGNVKRLPTPWKAIITSRAVWGALITHAGSGVAFIFFFTQVPSYIHYILGINVKSSGFLSSLPYAASFFTSISFGLISDFFTNKKILKLKNARRIFNSISQVGIAVALVCASFTTSTAVAVICLVIAMGCHMGIHVGWMVNHIDLAPNFSGTLMMIGNTMMNILNMMLPIVVSYVVTDVTNQIQWRIMFFIVAGLALTTNVIFVIFMSADTQPWNEGQADVNLEDLKLKDETKANGKH